MTRRGWALPPRGVAHTVVCETCGQLSVRPAVTRATGRFLAAAHAEVEPSHTVAVRPAGGAQ